MSQLYKDLLQAFKEITQIEKNEELAKEIDKVTNRDKKRKIKRRNQ